MGVYVKNHPDPEPVQYEDGETYHQGTFTFSQTELDALTPAGRRALLAHKMFTAEAALRDMLDEKGIEIAEPPVVPFAPRPSKNAQED